MSSVIQLSFVGLCLSLLVTGSEHVSSYGTEDIQSIKDLIHNAYNSMSEAMHIIHDLEQKLKSIENLCVWQPFNGHFYYFSEDKKPWEEAKRACRKMGGDLVTIEDAKENQWIKDVIGNSTKQLWIGLKREKCETLHKKDGWHWESNFHKPVFARWARSEPNSCNEKCGHIDSSKKGEWNDNFCYQKFNFICERDNIINV